MRNDNSPSTDGSWRQGLLQRLEDINTELEREAPRVLARHAEACETPSNYQRQCRDILEQLRHDCADMDARNGTTALPAPTPMPPAAQPLVRPMPGEHATQLDRPQILPAQTASSADHEPALEIPAISNESILAYASSSNLLAESMAERLKIGLWVGVAACMVIVASVSGLLVARLIDASQSTSAKQAPPARSAPATARKPTSVAPVESAERAAASPDISAFAAGIAWLKGTSATASAHAAVAKPPKLTLSQRPQLIADMFVRRDDKGAIPIALRLDGAEGLEFERHVVLFRDLPEGANLSHGSRVGPRVWSLSPKAMEHVILALPESVANVVDMRVELVDPLGELLSRTRLRLRLQDTPAPRIALGNLDLIIADQIERRRLDLLARESVALARMAAAEAASATQRSPAPTIARAEPTPAAKPAPAAASSAKDDEEEDEEPAPKPVKVVKRATARVPPPSALGAPPPKPTSGSERSAAAKPAAKLSRLIGSGPEWSPFRAGGTDSRQ